MVFGEGRRPETSTLVNLPAFDGPLGLLLALIESQKLDVLTVPLGVLAGAYLEALATLEGDRIGNVCGVRGGRQPAHPHQEPGDAAAARARGARRRFLDEGGDPEAELRTRLLLYRAFRDGGLRLQAGALDRMGLFRREPAVAQAAAIAGSVRRRPRRWIRRARRAPSSTSSGSSRRRRDHPRRWPATVTIAERTEVIRAALRRAGSIVLQELLRTSAIGSWSPSRSWPCSSSPSSARSSSSRPSRGDRSCRRVDRPPRNGHRADARR